MEDWLKDLWHKFKYKKIGLAILFIIVLFAILNPVSLISDIGFAEEVRHYRTLILKVALIVALVFIFVSYHINLYRERNTLKRTIKGLQSKVDEVEQDKESAFRLMERYKEEAQEDILNRLQQLATFSLRQQEWQQKGAKIERFRLEPSLNQSNLHTELIIAENVTVLINLGAQDSVTKGMRFIVQDPNDLQRYGVIIINECSEKGSACKIIEMSHQAFWYEVVQAVESKEGKAKILTASANMIVPDSPLKDMPPDGAKRLLEWLQTIKGVEL